MSAPIGLIIKNNLDDMQIGDCIPCRYTATTSGVAGYFSELGTCISNEIPVTGSATPDGLFYLIKTDKGTLIADRVIQTNISWDVLNGAKFIEGKPVTIGTKSILIQSLSGGVAYADNNGNLSLTDKSLGAWPTNNEWDKYIVNSDLKGKITKGDDNIWHWRNNTFSFCKDTPLTASFIGKSTVSANNTHRTGRGNGVFSDWWFAASNATFTTIGFRPVLNYIETDISSEVIY